MNAEVHSARGLPALINGSNFAMTSLRRRVCGVVMSKGNKVRLRGLERVFGYWGTLKSLTDGGGIVEAGFGEVNAKTRAVATASA